MRKFILAVVVAIATWLILAVLFGPLLTGTNVSAANKVGVFFVAYGWLIGLLFGLWYFFAGSTWFAARR